MRIHELVRMIEEYFYLGIAVLIMISILGGICYFFIYKKLMNGEKKLEKRQTFIGFLLTIYIIMVIGVTFLNRGGSFYGNANLHFLSSYREAWNTFAIRNWQFIILNILMFVPLGILLPMLHKNFHNKKWTIGLAFILTLLIECVQLITGFGIFELDDIFNNLLGAVIGYGVVMGIFELIKGKNIDF